MSMDKDMDMVEKFMLMGLFMKGVIVMIDGKVLEGVYRVILVIILENGKMIINMDMVLMFILMGKFNKENGNKMNLKADINFYRYIYLYI
jgi:hypothetical protein